MYFCNLGHNRENQICNMICSRGMKPVVSRRLKLSCFHQDSRRKPWTCMSASQTCCKTILAFLTLKLESVRKQSDTLYQYNIMGSNRVINQIVCGFILVYVLIKLCKFYFLYPLRVCILTLLFIVPNQCAAEDCGAHPIHASVHQLRFQQHSSIFRSQVIFHGQ